jgi:Superinfection immunity protein
MNNLAHTTETTPGDFYFAFVVVMIMFGIYFMPGLIATMRSHRNALAIWTLAILAGWSGIGWILAMVWSCTDNTRK